MNAWGVIELLFKLRQRALTTGTPVAVVLDNAGYQVCNIVQDSARLMGIELIYLPPYSPNLNLIEGLWKFVKRKWLYSVQYPSFEAFSEGIMGGLERAHLDYSSELNSLLTLRFQTLPNLKKSA